MKSLKEFEERGQRAQSAVDAILKPRKKMTGKTICEFDGTRIIYADGRCVFCGDRRKEAARAVRQWEKEHPQYVVQTSR
jgi:hypothetical protein